MVRKRKLQFLIVLFCFFAFWIMIISRPENGVETLLGYFSNKETKETTDVPERDFKFIPLNSPAALYHVMQGGEYRPPYVTSQEITAIIVPYRDRPLHRQTFLRHMHAFLQKQHIHYMIFFVEMTMPTTFNRGLLLNVGFLIAEKTRNFTCYVFHDVDLLPAHNASRYVCNGMIHHYSVENSKFQYKLPYDDYVGGIVAFPGDLYRQINGFSNAYFGWGGEDDDLGTRIQNASLGLQRRSGDAGRYYALDHDDDAGNPLNKKRYDILLCKTGWEKDGLNTIKYELMTRESRALYTWILIKVDEQAVMATIAMSIRCVLHINFYIKLGIIVILVLSLGAVAVIKRWTDVKSLFHRNGRILNNEICRCLRV